MTTEHRLERAITSPQYFALAFGCVVGVAWMVILGGLIGKAGPVGAALAIAAGGLVMVLVASCYAEMSGLRPAAGGELVYAYELYGPAACYAVGWTLALLCISTAVFEAISLGLVSDLLFPGIQGTLLYRVFGSEVHLGSLLVGTLGVAALWAINVFGTTMTARAQEWITYVRVALMIAFLGIAICFANPANLQPLFGPATGSGGTLAFLGVLVTTPFIFGGFSVFATATEESSTRCSKRMMGRAVVFAVLAATVFYIVLILAVGTLVPQAELRQMQLPAAEAFKNSVPGGLIIAKVVLATALLGNLTAWNSLLIAGARVLFALGRAGLSAEVLGRTHPRWRTPANAIGFISLIALAGMFLGRGFILPVVNVSSACFALAYFVTAAAVLRLRRTDAGAERHYGVPGGRVTAWLALLMSLAILVIAVAQPYLANPGHIPPEWWVILGWALIGWLIWTMSGKRRRAMSPQDRWRRLSGRELTPAATSAQAPDAIAEPAAP